MRLRRLTLVNFRGFERLELLLEEDLTALVGVNGSGKTSVLEAIARVVHMNVGGPAPGFAERDKRVGSDELHITVDAEMDGEPVQFFYHDPGGSGTGAGIPPSKRPFIFYYPVTRNAEDSTPNSAGFERWEPPQARDGAVQTSATFEQLFRWFREREDLENEDRLASRDYRDPQLEAVRKAIESLLPGYTNPRVQRPRPESQNNRGPQFVIDKGGHPLAFSQFSTGERSYIALVADIARRLAIANPGHPPLSQEAFVLIDEVELHLHPRWQASAPETLQRTFPNVQFLLATHSPLVLSRVPSRCVRILDDFKLVKAGAPTEGRDPNALYAEVFDTPLRPSDVQHQIAVIADLIDRESLDDAKGRLEELGRRLGQTDTDVTRLRTMIELLSA